MYKIEFWIYKWIESWLSLICEFIHIITLCIYRPWWDFKFLVWSSKHLTNKYRDEALWKKIK